VPLHEVGSAHERAVFAGTSVVVPQIEIHKINLLRKRRAGKQAFFTQPIHNILRRSHTLICDLYGLFSLTYGTSRIVMGVQARQTGQTLHSVLKDAA